MRLTFEIAVSDPDVALQIQDDLQQHPDMTVESTDNPDSDGFTGGEVLLVMVVVVGAAETVNLVADVVYKIVQRFRKPVVLDVTGEEPKVTVLDEVDGFRGEVFIVKRHDEELVRESGPDHSKILDALKRLMKP